MLSSEFNMKKSLNYQPEKTAVPRDTSTGYLNNLYFESEDIPVDERMTLAQTAVPQDLAERIKQTGVIKVGV